VERIAIFAALRWECQPVLRQLRQAKRQRVADFTVWRSTTSGREICLMKTGVGAEQADTAAKVMSDTGEFALFLSTGCAGALAPELTPGDLTVATAVIGNGSGARFEADAAQRERLRHVAERAALRTVVGPVLCSPHALTTVVEKKAAAERGAAAVEMEGAQIAACAAQAGIPFASVRAILDTAEMELPYAGRFIDEHSGAVKPLALAGYLATHPSAVSDLLAMQRMMRAAQHSLERFFAAWFSTLDC
jgi:adenosylhomocysteine nucleosidase